MHQHHVIPARRRHPADDRAKENAADAHQLNEDDGDDQVRHGGRHSTVFTLHEHARRLAVDLNDILIIIGGEIVNDDPQHAVGKEVILPDPYRDKRLKYREKADAQHRNQKIISQIQAAENKGIPVPALADKLVSDARGYRLKNARQQVLKNLNDHVVIIVDADRCHADPRRDDQVIRRRADRAAHLIQSHRVDAGKNILLLPVGKRFCRPVDIRVMPVCGCCHQKVRHDILRDQQHRINKERTQREQHNDLQNIHDDLAEIADQVADVFLLIRREQNRLIGIKQVGNDRLHQIQKVIEVDVDLVRHARHELRQKRHQAHAHAENNQPDDAVGLLVEGHQRPDRLPVIFRQRLIKTERHRRGKSEFRNAEKCEDVRVQT